MKWHFGVKRPVYLLDASAILEGDIEELKKLIGIGYSQSFLIIEKGMGAYYTPKVEVEKQIKILTADLDKTKKLLAEFPRYKLKLKEALEKLIKEVDDKNYSCDSFKKFLGVYRQYVGFRVLTRILGYKEDLSKDFLKKVGQIRMDYKNEWTKAREVLDNIWSKIARHYKVPEESIKSLTLKEFLNGLSISKFDPRVLERNRKKIVLYRDKHSERILVGGKAEKFIESTLGKTKIEKTDIMRGQVACLGSVRGTVKVILEPEEIKTKQKFILVTSMTTPAFVPILKHARAIITDEGGLTCHAAIISRELKIPCVIGTKTATKVLKDGDLVEVDANKGIVRKLKS